MKLSEYAGERDDAEFWARAQPRREPIRTRWFLPAVALSLTVSVPWYWSGTPPVIAGLPAWVWGTLAGSAALSVLTGIAAWLFWQDVEPAAELEPRAEPRQRDESEERAPEARRQA